MRGSLFAVLLLGMALRIALLPWAPLVAHRPELQPGAASLTALREGVWAQARGVSPYGRGALHQPPVVLAALRLVPPPLWLWLAPACDALTALLLAALGGPLLAAAYLLNPLSVAASLAGSPAAWGAPAVAAALLLCVRGRGVAAGLALAVAATLRPMMCVLLPVLWATDGSVPAAVGGVALGAVASWLVSGSWLWVADVWGYAFASYDVTPDLGLHWYFFTELFPPFEALFRVTWLVFVCAPLPSLAYSLRAVPAAAWLVALLVLATLCPRPAATDVALAHALVPLVPGAPRVALPAYYVCVTMLGVFWDLWLYQGAGNANFYYGATVAAALANVYLLVGAANGERVRLYLERHGLKRE